MSSAEKGGFHARLWRGERMCLAGMDVEHPEDDFVGFAIEVKRPGASHYMALRNRLAFSYPAGPTPVTGAKQYSSIEAPFQKFRWVHFPQEPGPGIYRYRITKMHMPAAGRLVKGTQLTLDIGLDPITCPGFLDIGFTRNFASSQAYNEQFGGREDILPASNAAGLEFVPPADAEAAYRWLGFEAAALIYDTLDAAVADPSVSVDCFAYDLNVGAIVERLEKLGPRLRAVIDDSKDDHFPPDSAESKAAARLMAKGANVRRTHFRGLQHHKVIIIKRGGVAEKVLLGSTNFSYRGLYIQANNALLFTNMDMAGLFAQAFEQSFNDPAHFAASPLARKWHAVNAAGQAPVQICLSPHADSDMPLGPVGAAIDQASSSVFYSIAFLSQTKSGPVRASLDRLTGRPLFSYGVVDKTGGMEVHKPDGSIGLVDFAYLSANAPPPFSAEWAGGKGINIHNKYVVTDFNLPTAKVFTGSSNLSPSGEKGNGDHLLMIEDQAVATAYAINAILLFDHLHFRSAMKDAGIAARGTTTRPAPLTLATPQAIGGKPPWFTKYYVPDSQYLRDRLLFGH